MGARIYRLKKKAIWFCTKSLEVYIRVYIWKPRSREEPRIPHLSFSIRNWKWYWSRGNLTICLSFSLNTFVVTCICTYNSISLLFGFETLFPQVVEERIKTYQLIIELEVSRSTTATFSSTSFLNFWQSTRLLSIL